MAFTGRTVQLMVKCNIPKFLPDATSMDRAIIDIGELGKLGDLRGLGDLLDLGNLGDLRDLRDLGD
jgi:hypothetical protein